MSRFRMWTCACATVAVLTGAQLATAAGQFPATIEERAKGAERIVVASVAEIHAAYETNEYGDELIVSHARLALEDVIKGNSDKATLALAGGTVNGITLRVSHLPTLSHGERAVFFLDRRPDGEYKPHLDGQGILKLDSTNHVKGSSLTVEDIRRMSGATPR